MFSYRPELLGRPHVYGEAAPHVRALLRLPRAPLLEKKTKVAKAVVFHCACATCGEYDIDQKLIVGEKNGPTLSADLRLRVSHAIRTATDAHGSLDQVLDYYSVKLIADQRSVT